MVIRGKTRGNGSQLANYLLTKGDNEIVNVLDIQGTAHPDNLQKSLLEMSLTSELTKSDKGLYHAQINPAIGEDSKMQPSDWLKAAKILEKELGLEGQKRAIVLHEKKGRVHAHVVWERYDHAKGIMISDSFSRLAQDRARKSMEISFEQNQTPHRNIQKAKIKEELSDLWATSKGGEHFIALAKTKGYSIGIGRERPYVVFDDTGRSFDLVKQIRGVKTKDVRDRFKGIDLSTEKKIIAALEKKKTALSANKIQAAGNEKNINPNLREPDIRKEEVEQFLKELQQKKKKTREGGRNDR